MINGYIRSISAIDSNDDNNDIVPSIVSTCHEYYYVDIHKYILYLTPYLHHHEPDSGYPYTLKNMSIYAKSEDKRHKDFVVSGSITFVILSIGLVVAIILGTMYDVNFWILFWPYIITIIGLPGSIGCLCCEIPYHCCGKNKNKHYETKQEEILLFDKSTNQRCISTCNIFIDYGYSKETKFQNIHEANIILDKTSIAKICDIDNLIGFDYDGRKGKYWKYYGLKIKYHANDIYGRDGEWEQRWKRGIYSSDMERKYKKLQEIINNISDYCRIDGVTFKPLILD